MTEQELRERMQAYEQELLRLQQQSRFTQPPTEEAVSEQPTVQEGTIPLQEESSESPSEIPQAAQGAEPSPNVPLPNGMDTGNYTATFQVRVSAADGALPVEGASVSISRPYPNGNELLRVLTTDRSGLTETIELPAADPALTLQPNLPIVQAVYDVLVTADGYSRVRTTGIPLYGGIPTVLPIRLIPLPEFNDNSGEQVNPTTPPMGL